jgi:hypothetical protein
LLSTVRGGLGSPAYRVSVVPVPGAVYGLRHWAQKGQRKGAKLTKELWRLGLRRREETDGDRRRRGRALAEEGVTGGLRAPGHRRSMREGPAEVPEGLGTSGDHRRRRIAGRHSSPAAVSSRNLGDAEARGTIAGVGSFQARRRSGCGAYRGLWHGGAAARRRGRGSLRGGGKWSGGVGGPRWRLGLGFRGGVGAAL